MQARKIERAEKFDRELRKLNQKHLGLAEKLESILSEISADKNEGKRLKGFGEDKVFKIRCGTQSMGKRRSARVIYYKNDSVIILLCIFFKNQKSDIQHKTIEERLSNVFERYRNR